MAWDSTKPAPWRKLTRDWCVYAVLALIGMVIWTQATERSLKLGMILGLLASGPLFIALGAILAKFGYQRKTLRQLRAEDTAKRRIAAETPERAAQPGAARVRPAPTRRTAHGPANIQGRRRSK